LFLAGDGVITDVALQTRGSAAAILVALLVLVAMWKVGRNRLVRSEGALLLGAYASVLALLASSASG
ncbi:MAG: hypothetical protein P8M16_05605, partial [Acidimicrobiales bacterium]|nr:hypothetical protein [Acidimicrobiales bacterium]